MAELCRVSIDELNNDKPCSWAHEMEQTREMNQKHKELTVLLLSGLEGRLQEYLENEYQDFSDLVDNGEARIMERYLSNTLSQKVMDLIEKEAENLASIMLG